MKGKLRDIPLLGGLKRLLNQQRSEPRQPTDNSHKTSRAFKMLSACNQAVGRATEEMALLQEVCQIIVGVGGYRLAWVGLAEEDEEKSVCPVAQVGYEEGYLDTANITWADNERGRGPTGTAIRNGRPVIIRHILTNPTFAPWRDQAVQRGYASSAALPLSTDGQPFGALNVYAKIPDAFDEFEVALLTQLADDVAYGLAALRTRSDREEMLLEMQKRAEELSTLFEAARVVSSTLELEEVLQLIAQQLVMAVGAAGCALSRWERSADRLTTWIEYRNPGTGIPDRPGTAYALAKFPAARQVLKTGEPLVIYATEPGADSAELSLMQARGQAAKMILPIKAGDEVLGLIDLDDTSRGRKFTSDEIRLCQTLANQAAMAIRNAGLLRETQQQAQRMEYILQAVREGVILLDEKHTILLANPVGQRFLDQLAGAQVGEVLTELGGHPLGELLKSVSANGLPRELEFGEQQRFFEFAAAQLHSGPQQGGWVLILREITEERRRQQYEYEQARLATVGQLAAGVAHDFNNILAVMMLYTELLLKTPDLSSQNQERLSTVWQQARLAANLTTQILDFSRRSVMERSSFEFVSFLKEFLKLMERTLPENIDISFTHDRKQYVVNGDPTRLQQVLMNLSLNGRDAMPDGGKLHFVVDGLSLEPGRRPPLPDMEPGDWLRLSISDTGLGIEEQYLSRVFEPFFTTKAPGQGTGLGLAQAYGIIKQHEGHIDVNSRIGRGTTFTMYLPVLVLSGASLLREDTFTGALMTGDGETILVVEDDEATRKAVDDVLTSLGYRVLQAANGKKALTLFDLYGQNIDLVLSDLVMPDMGGETLFRTLRQTSEIKMVMMTGHPLDGGGQSLLEQGIVAWLPKPFTAETIARIVHQALRD